MKRTIRRVILALIFLLSLACMIFPVMDGGVLAIHFLVC